MDASATASTAVADANAAAMDANAPAGNINLKTKRAFDRKGRFVGMSVSTVFNSEEFSTNKTVGPNDGYGRKFKPNFSLNYSDVFLNNRLGIVLSVQESNVYVEQYRVDNNYNRVPTPGDPRTQVITSVLLKDGQTLPDDMVIWAAGVGAHKSVTNWGFEQGRGGRIATDGTLLVEGQDRIFAVGDGAINTEDPKPQLAQPAIQGGECVARQIVHLELGEPLEKFGSTSLGDAGSAVDDQVIVQAHGVALVSFDGQRDTAVVADIAHLAVLA